MRDSGDGGGRFDRRSNYDRPSYDRGYGGPQGRDSAERDRDPYSDDGPGSYNRGGPGGGHGRRGPPDSPSNLDGRGLSGPGGSGEFTAGRRLSRAFSPDDSQAGPPLSKVMFIKRMIDEDLPEKEIDRRCACVLLWCTVQAPVCVATTVCCLVAFALFHMMMYPLVNSASVNEDTYSNGDARSCTSFRELC